MTRQTPKTENADYCVLYRSGGTHYATWQRVFERFTYADARKEQDKLFAMGYRALVQSFEQLNKLGMPVGWESDSVDWSSDEIKVEHDKNGMPCRTVHIKREIAA